jgi:hypothetical protein
MTQRPIWLLGTLATHARGKVLFEATGAISIESLPNEFGLCLAFGSDFQTADSSTQQAWVTWTLLSGRTLLLIPPYNVTECKLPVTWRAFRPQKPDPIGTDQLGKLVASELRFEIAGRLQTAVEVVGEWKGGGVHTAYYRTTLHEPSFAPKKIVPERAVGRRTGRRLKFPPFRLSLSDAFRFFFGGLIGLVITSTECGICFFVALFTVAIIGEPIAIYLFAIIIASSGVWLAKHFSEWLGEKVCALHARETAVIAFVGGFSFSHTFSMELWTFFFAMLTGVVAGILWGAMNRSRARPFTRTVLSAAIAGMVVGALVRMRFPNYSDFFFQEHRQNLAISGVAYLAAVSGGLLGIAQRLHRLRLVTRVFPLVELCNALFLLFGVPLSAVAFVIPVAGLTFCAFFFPVIWWIPELSNGWKIAVGVFSGLLGLFVGGFAEEQAIAAIDRVRVLEQVPEEPSGRDPAFNSLTAFLMNFASQPLVMTILLAGTLIVGLSIGMKWAFD